MCLIADANVAAIVFASPPAADFEPVFEALAAGQAKAVYGGQLWREYKRITRIRRILAELDRRGSVRRLPSAQVDQVAREISAEGLCISNDTHILALARLSQARLLCSKDRDLHSDFTNPLVLQPKGSIYQDPAHANLIRRHCRKASGSKRRSGGNK